MDLLVELIPHLSCLQRIILPTIEELLAWDDRLAPAIASLTNLQDIQLDQCGMLGAQLLMEMQSSLISAHMYYQYDYISPGALECCPTYALKSHRHTLRELTVRFANWDERNEPFPEAKTTAVNFSEFDSDPAKSHYVVEWLPVELPAKTQRSEELIGQAA